MNLWFSMFRRDRQYESIKERNKTVIDLSREK